MACRVALDWPRHILGLRMWRAACGVLRNACGPSISLVSHPTAAGMWWLGQAVSGSGSASTDLASAVACAVASHVTAASIASRGSAAVATCAGGPHIAQFANSHSYPAEYTGTGIRPEVPAGMYLRPEVPVGSYIYQDMQAGSYPDAVMPAGNHCTRPGEPSGEQQPGHQRLSELPIASGTACEHPIVC